MGQNMKQWYYAYNNQQQGPVAESDLINLLASRQLPGNTLLWSDGMANWQMAQELNEFRHIFSAPAPSPTPPPPPPPQGGYSAGSSPSTYQQPGGPYQNQAPYQVPPRGRSEASRKRIMLIGQIVGAIILCLFNVPGAFTKAQAYPGPEGQGFIFGYLMAAIVIGALIGWGIGRLIAGSKQKP